MTLVAPPQEQQRPSKASPRMRRKRAPATPQTTEKPIRNASTNTTPPPCHSRACKAQPCRSSRASRISSARPRTTVVTRITSHVTTVNNALDPISTLDQIRISTLDIARDAGIEIPTPRLLDSIGNRAALTMDTLIRLIAFHCLSDTFHCYLTYDPDYFRGADRFPGWDSLCLDPPGFRIDIGCVCVRSRIPIPCLLCAIPVV